MVSLPLAKATPRGEANPPSPSGCGGRPPSPASLLLSVSLWIRHRRRSWDPAAWRSQRGSRGVPKPTLRTFFLILGLALAVRGILLMTVAPQKPTAWETELIAKNLLSGKGFTFIYTGSVPYRAYKPPLYEWMTAGVYLLTHQNHDSEITSGAASSSRSQRAMVLLQCVFGALLAGVCFLIGRILFGTAAGVITGICVALHPALIYYDTHQLHALTLGGLLIASIAWIFLKLRVRNSWMRRLLAGALIGLAVHERGTAGIFLPIAITWLWAMGDAGMPCVGGSTPGGGAQSRATRVTRGQLLWRSAGPLILGFVLVITPWTLRNAAVYHRFVFMTSLTGELFWRGNNPQATGTTVTSDLTPMLGTLPPEFEQKMAAMDELSQQDYLRQEAWAFIRSNPKKAALLFIKKFLMFWWFAPTSGYRYPRVYLLTYQIFYLGALLLGLYGLLTPWSFPRKEDDIQGMALLISMALGFSLLQSFYYVEIRHRWAIEPLLLVFTGGGLVRLLPSTRRG